MRKQLSAELVNKVLDAAIVLLNMHGHTSEQKIFKNWINKDFVLLDLFQENERYFLINDYKINNPNNIHDNNDFFKKEDSFSFLIASTLKDIRYNKNFEFSHDLKLNIFKSVFTILEVHAKFIGSRICQDWSNEYFKPIDFFNEEEKSILYYNFELYNSNLEDYDEESKEINFLDEMAFSFLLSSAINDLIVDNKF